MTLDTDYVELLVAHRPAKPRNRQELAAMTALLETLAANETAQTPAMLTSWISTVLPGRFGNSMNYCADASNAGW